MYKINHNLIKIVVTQNLLLAALRMTRNKYPNNSFKFNATPTYWPIPSFHVLSQFGAPFHQNILCNYVFLDISVYI